MRALVAGLLVIVGVLAVIVGVLYLTQPAHSLPSFFPGYGAHVTGKHPSRGIAATVVGGVLILSGVIVAWTARRQRSWYY